MINVRLWGVRGSIPCPGPSTVRYGGNTACLELRFGEEERLVIIDAGSGIRQLGDHLMKNDLPKGPIRTKIFLSHTHWDHIMGFPFFTPIFIPGSELEIYGPVTYEDEGLDRIIGDQLRYRYFPVKHSELAAKISYHPMKERSMDLGEGLWVTTKYLNHPILCLGYRFEYKGKVFCTIPNPSGMYFPRTRKIPITTRRRPRKALLRQRKRTKKSSGSFREPTSLSTTPSTPSRNMRTANRAGAIPPSNTPSMRHIRRELKSFFSFITIRTGATVSWKPSWMNTGHRFPQKAGLS
jgi:hypothetical protein